MKFLLKLAFLAFLLLRLVEGFFAPRVPEEVSVPALAGPEASMSREAAEGHGVYCASEGRSAVFLGRDLPEASSYPDFEAWCEGQGGEVGWSA